MKKICIHQPDFAPYIGFFERLLNIDLFIILDNVQFINDGWQHRDKIKTERGSDWLTLSLSSGRTFKRLNEISLSQNSKWRNDCINKVNHNYRKAKYFNDFFPKIKNLFLNPETSLVEYNLKFIEFFNEIFEINVPLIRSSELKVEGKSNELLINICKQLEATHYLTGTGSRDYLNEALFQENQIQVEWQNFVHPIYPQLHGEFIPYLSVIDLILNCGNESKKYFN